MAARRLLIVMLVFLAVSSVLAALAPPPAERRTGTTTDSTTTDPTTTATATASTPKGALVHRRVEVSGRPAKRVAVPGRIDLRPGDQLALEVSPDRSMTLEIPQLGLIEAGSPAAPARFDLFFSSAQRLALTDAETGRRLVRIVVRARGS